MLRYHMAVVTRDNALKREVKRVTTATGSTADFIGDPSGLDPSKKIDLAIFDARDREPNKTFFSKVPADAGIQYVLGGDALIERVGLLKEPRVTSLLCHDARFDDDEFIASATKALRGEVFGLQKYFPWGVTTFTMQLKNYKQKTRAIDVLMRYAKLAGVRGPVRDRIQLVCDELMMNALYHAPTDDEGKERFLGQNVRDLAKLDEVPAIEVQYGCSGRYFAVSVRDGGGSLSRKKLLDYLMRAKAGAAHIETKAGGAGLGLISVLRSVSKLVFNLDPGYSTEVIAIFDMELFAKGKVGARSLHLFTQSSGTKQSASEDAAEPRAPSESDQTEPDAPTGGTHAGKWIVVALLLALLSGMATAYLMKRGDSKTDSAANTLPQRTAATSPTLVVNVHPASARPATTVITVNGTKVHPGAAVSVDTTKPVVTIKVTSKGFKTHTQELETADWGGRTVLEVNLAPSR